MDVLSARILANGEDSELVDAIAAQQQPVKYMTDLDYDPSGLNEGRSSPNSDSAVIRTDTDALIVGSPGASSSGGGKTSAAHRYSYRAAIYQQQTESQDIG